MHARLWIPPLAVAASAIVVAVWSTRESRAPASLTATPAPALDWNDDGAFVVDPSGVPVVGAVVQAFPKSSQRAVFEELRTDERGHFRLAVPAVYALWITAGAPPPGEDGPPLLFALELDLAPPLHGMRITAAPLDEFPLRVVYPDGSAASSFALAHDGGAWLGGGVAEFRPVWSDATSTDVSGVLRLWGRAGAAATLRHSSPTPGMEGGCLASTSVVCGTVVLGPDMPALVVER